MGVVMIPEGGYEATVTTAPPESSPFARALQQAAIRNAIIDSRAALRYYTTPTTSLTPPITMVEYHSVYHL